MIWKTNVRLLNERFFEQFFEKKLSFFTERTVLLNKWFYWTNDITEREWFYRDIVQLENDQNR